MSDINVVAISGRLVKDPVVRETRNGSYVMNFTIACNERHKRQDSDEWEDVPNFVDCALFGNRCKTVEKYVSKGTKVNMSGRLHQSKWTTESGENRSKLELLVEEIEWPRTEARGSYQAQAQPRPQMPANDLYGSDIPF